MNTVTITKTKSGFSNGHPFYQIGNHYDDTSSLSCLPVTYGLPEGYYVAECQAGTLEIYSANNQHCSIVEHSSGHPQLVTSGREMPVLKPIADAAHD